MNINNIFPTPVAFFKLNRDLTEIELAFIKGQEHYKNTGNTTSKNRKILKSKELTELREFIEDSMFEYFKSIHSPKFDVSLYLTQSWANYTEKGQFHHKHSHSNSVVSGVFYPQANRTVDKIYFYKDEYNQLEFPVAEYNPYNSKSWWFEVGGRIMAHYAFLNENNIVTDVIVGKNEGEDGVDWEQWYGDFRGQVCKRTSYNTIGNTHSNGGTPYRGNYAGIGYTYRADIDAFVPPQPYASWTLDANVTWQPPTPMPTDGYYTWDEATTSWTRSPS